jgi:hypothetical protein
VPQLLEQTYKDFYGDGQRHQGVTKDLSESVIRHSIEYCDYLISQDDSLDDTMYDLRTELTIAPTDIAQDIEAEMDPFPGVVEEDQQAMHGRE